ncbi:unnamed protein product, partial [Toxocara canis]|uniref:U-box domain-containing protein n=1 Tax=Toxocara canis TaxID=6265 RepID=A0A183VG67_TOXCA
PAATAPVPVPSPAQISAPGAWPPATAPSVTPQSPECGQANTENWSRALICSYPLLPHPGNNLLRMPTCREIGLPLPDGDKVTSTDTPLDIVEFGSDLIIDRMFTAVGCGGESPCISAKLFCNAYWAERGVRTNRDGNICAPFNQRHEKYQQKGADRFELIPKVVRLCSDEEFDSDLRFEALKQRSERKLTKSKAMHRIGLISADIDPQILASDEQKINDQLRISTGIDAHRIAGNQYAAMIRLLFFLIPEISKLLLFQPSNS